MNTVLYKGHLTQTFKGNRPAPSALHTPPFEDVLDFESYGKLGRENYPRSFVTYERKYELLADIFSIIREEAAGQFGEILVYSRMPSIMRMPVELFGDDLFFLSDLEGESDRVAAQGISHFALREGFLRHSLEDGQNELELTWQLAPKNAVDVFDRMAARFETLGIAPETLGTAA